LEIILEIKKFHINFKEDHPMKKATALLLTAAMAASVMAPAAVYAEENDTWVMAINATFPPFESIADSTDSYVGIDIDLANYIAEKLGVELEIKDMQFSALVPTMQSGRADIIISGISPTEEREEILDFTDSYYYPMNAIICEAGDGYETLDTLENKKIGVSMGTSYASIAQSVEGAEVAELDSTPLIVQDILNGNCDAGIFDATQAAVFVQENEGLEMHIIESDITREDSFAIALPKGSEYVDQINEILAEMMEDGTFHDILVKYIGEESTAQYEAMLENLEAANE
jgi:polar amino acid transport system substrate-binding protein